MLELLGLRVHDELRFGAVLMQVGKGPHGGLQFLAAVFSDLALMRKLASQMIHHLLRFPAILQERVEPGLT